MRRKKKEMERGKRVINEGKGKGGESGWARARRIEEKACFHKVLDWCFDIGKLGSQREEKRRELEDSSCSSYLPLPLSFLHSLVSSASLHGVTVSDGTGLTGRRRSKKTVALGSASEMTYDTCAHTHTHADTHSSLVGVGDDITGSKH